MPDHAFGDIPELLASESLADAPEARAFSPLSVIHSNALFSVQQDEVAMSGGTTAVRDYLDHCGAVAVVALTEDHRCVLVRQYRHPVRSRLWELPAGVRDVAEEELVVTAQRELAEEAGLRAQSWTSLGTSLASPGCSSERIALFLAQELTPVPAAERPELQHEEVDMECRLVPMRRVLETIIRGDIRNGILNTGIFLAAVRCGMLTLGTSSELAPT